MTRRPTGTLRADGVTAALEIGACDVLVDLGDLGELGRSLRSGWSLQIQTIRRQTKPILRHRSLGTIQLARAIAQADECDRVDHLNGNSLDCRRANLRKVATDRRLAHASKLMRFIKQTTTN